MRALLCVLIFVGPWSFAAETVLARGAVCSSLRGAHLFVVNQRGVARRLRFQTRARCLALRRILKPYLDRARAAGGATFVTPTFDYRGRVTDLGPIRVDEDPFGH